MRTRLALGLTLLAIVSVLSGVVVSTPLATAAESTLSIEVTDDVGGLASLGSTVTFTYRVSNTGDATLTAIAVDDTLAGHLGDVASLGPGRSAVFSAAVVIEGAAAGGFGTCTAIGRLESGAQVAVSRDYSVDVFIGDDPSDCAVTKQALDSSVAPGGLVRYRLRVRVVKGGFSPAVRLVDDYDESLLSVVDAGKGSVGAGRIEWTVPETLYEGESFVTECAFRVREDAARRSGSDRVENVAFLRHLDGPDPDPGNDRATAAVRLVASGGSNHRGASAGVGTGASGGGDPFLPFTGPAPAIVPLAWLFGCLGYALRRLA